MSILDLKKVLRLITDDKINYHLYEYVNDRMLNTVKDSSVQCLDISKWVLFSVILKLSLPRDYKAINIININDSNKAKELEHNIEDSDSLFLININSRKHYVFYNGNKIYQGNCIISKNELIQLNNMRDVQITLVKKIYYTILVDVNDYCNILDAAFTLCQSEVSNDEEESIDFLIDKFVNNTIMDGRMYVADLIIRDYYNLLKVEIDKLENEGYKIYKVSNTKIFYI